MLPSWINDVWEQSLKQNVHCDDAMFQKHRIPPFYNLSICLTGFSDLEERQKLAKMITENGGKHSGELRIKTTDILVCNRFVSISSHFYIKIILYAVILFIVFKLSKFLEY